MLKLIFCVFCYFSLLYGQTDYFVARWGIDNTSSGSYTNPFKTVLFAISQLTSDGQTIEVLLDINEVEDSNIFEESPWVINKNSITIKGPDNSLMRPIIRFVPTGIDQKMVQINTKTNVTIKNLEFDFQNVIQSSNGNTYGIFAQRSSHNTTIENCYLYNSEVTPITIQGSNSCVIRLNVFGPITQTLSSWHKKVNNISFEAYQDPMNLTIYTCNDNQVWWNTFYPNNGHYPINFIHNSGTTGEFSSNNDIDANRIEGGWSGIFLSNQVNFHVHNNLIYLAKGYSASTSSIDFDEEIDGYGIHIGNTQGLNYSWHVELGAVYNNVFYNNYNTGITNFKGLGLRVYNNIFYDNGIEGTEDNNWHTFKIDQEEAIFSHNLYFNENQDTLRWMYAGNRYDNNPNSPRPLWGSLETSPFIEQDPQLNDPLNFDFTPVSGAFVIDAGYDLANENLLNTSFIEGITRPINDYWDVGAYESEHSMFQEELMLQLVSAELINSNCVELNFNTDLDTSYLRLYGQFYLGSDKKVNDIEIINLRKIRLHTTSHNSQKYNIVFVQDLKSSTGLELVKQFSSMSYSSENLNKINPKGISINEFSLNQNFPNPFNPITKITYSLPKQSYVELRVFNILGREVANLINKIQDAGNHEVEFHATNLSSGIYFYTLKSGDFSQTKKLVVLK